MRKVFITGVNGFVGRALCERLSREAWRVAGSVRSDQNAANLPSHVDTVRIPSIDQDVDWPTMLAGVNAVVHLAARVHIMHDTSSDPLSAFRRVNVDGTERLARQAAAVGVRRFVYISSVKVNGEESSIPYVEQDTPNPQDAYAVSKWEAEQTLRCVAGETGLETVVIRPPLVYGPGVKANFLQLIRTTKRGLPLPLASVHNKRSLIYLHNLVDAIVTCISHRWAINQTYLVSDGEDLSTPDLIYRLAAALGATPRLFPCPPALIRMAGMLAGKSVEVERLIGSLTVDTTKIRSELGWQAPYSVAKGLKETADWFRSQNV